METEMEIETESEVGEEIMLDDNRTYTIVVTNISDKERTKWNHRNVPSDHVKNIMLSPNLKVKVVRADGYSKTPFKR